MSRDYPGGIHFHSFWAARAEDKELPNWLRLAALAYSSHCKNGHATFYLDGKSTLPELLGLSEKHTKQEIKRSVKRCFLHPASNINCLVLPAGIEGGAEGNKYAKCRHHPAAENLCRYAGVPAGRC